ncbi:MAG: hypothetical protein ACOCUL_03565 [Bacteroidota bacterium]
MIRILKNHEKEGGSVSVVCYYDPEDEFMRDEVEDFILETGMHIALKPM